MIPHNQAYTIADLGTGSGAIAAAIAAERPLSALFATDNSAEALAVAEENFRHHELRNIQCRRGSWCHALPANRQFDLLLSNPPYVAEGDPHLQQDGLPWEPKGALTAGADGLNEIRRIVQQAPSHLRAGGWLLLEHGWEQGAAVRALLACEDRVLVTGLGKSGIVARKIAATLTSTGTPAFSMISAMLAALRMP